MLNKEPQLGKYSAAKPADAARQQSKQQQASAALVSEQRLTSSPTVVQVAASPTVTEDSYTSCPTPAASKRPAQDPAIVQLNRPSTCAAVFGASRTPAAASATNNASVVPKQPDDTIKNAPARLDPPALPGTAGVSCERSSVGRDTSRHLSATVTSGGSTATANMKSQVTAARDLQQQLTALHVQSLPNSTAADSSDWSQDSSSLSDNSFVSAGEHAKLGSQNPELQACHDSQRPSAQHCNALRSQHQQQQVQHSSIAETQQQAQHQVAGTPQVNEQQGFTTLQQLDDLREQQHQWTALEQPLHQEMQQQLQLNDPKGHSQQQQQQQHSLSDGHPGLFLAAAAAAAGVSAVMGDAEEHSESAAVVDSSMVRARMSADPDYELPQGKLTETQVLMAHGGSLRLDRYGFILGASDMTGRTVGTSAPAAGGARQRSASQVRRDCRHIAKWRRMLGSSAADFEACCKEKRQKVKRRVRKGIPDEFRGYVWQLLSGGYAMMQSQPGMYERLLSHSPDAVDLEIMRDLNRTFPNHVFFHQRQGPGQQSLFHVLRAYSALDRQVGYVQGMGFVSAILLMYMSEEAAFWTLVALLKGTPSHPPLEGLYQAGMPLLQQCLFQLHELLKQDQPRLGSHLEGEGVVPSMYCTHWFNTLFAYSLPFEQLLRVWDVFLLEGMKVIFRVGIALLVSAQEQLCSMPFEHLVAALNGRKFPILTKHPDVLIKAAMKIPVSSRLRQSQRSFLALQAETQAAAAAAANGTGGKGAAGSITSTQTPAAQSGAAAEEQRGSTRSHSSAGHKRTSSVRHAQQQLVAGLAPVRMGPDS